MTPALTGAGQILQVGKRGIGYLLRAQSLGGIGGQIAKLRICPAFGGAAVRGDTVIVPCAGGGPAAVSTRGGLQVAWRRPSSADGSPVIGGRTAWVADKAPARLSALSP